MNPELKNSINIALEQKNSSSSTEQDSVEENNTNNKLSGTNINKMINANNMFSTIIRKDIDRMAESLLDSINERDDLTEIDNNEIDDTNDNNTMLNCTFKHTRMDD